MNAKIKKIVQITAAGLFLVALLINIKVTLNDPFQIVSEQALATGSGGGSNGCTKAGEFEVSQIGFKNVKVGDCYNSDGFLCGAEVKCTELTSGTPLPPNQGVYCYPVLCAL